MANLTTAEIRACDDVRLGPMGIAAPIIADVLQLTGVTAQELNSGDRTARVSRTRQIIMTALRDRGMTLPQIGGLLGCDHTTVLHGVRAERNRSSRPIMFKSVRAK